MHRLEDFEWEKQHKCILGRQLAEFSIEDKQVKQSATKLMVESWRTHTKGNLGVLRRNLGQQ